jgi:hypothetical protein
MLPTHRPVAGREESRAVRREAFENVKNVVTTLSSPREARGGGIIVVRSTGRIALQPGMATPFMYRLVYYIN